MAPAEKNKDQARRPLACNISSIFPVDLFLVNRTFDGGLSIPIFLPLKNLFEPGARGGAPPPRATADVYCSPFTKIKGTYSFCFVFFLFSLFLFLILPTGKKCNIFQIA